MRFRGPMIRRQGISGCSLRSSSVRRCAASPRISISRSTPRRNSRLIRYCSSDTPRVNSCTAFAESSMSHRLAASRLRDGSGGIEDAVRPQDVAAPKRVAKRAPFDQIDWAPDEILDLLLKGDDVQE